jgi:hypothetical protein
MTKIELIKAIKKCNRVYGIIRLTEDDNSSVQLVKADLLFSLQDNFDNNPNRLYKALLTDDNYLYIG